jgi:hypothetical protein
MTVRRKARDQTAPNGTPLQVAAQTGCLVRGTTARSRAEPSALRRLSGAGPALMFAERRPGAAPSPHSLGRAAAQPAAGVARWNSRAAHPISPAGNRGSLPKKPRWLASAADQILSTDTGRHSCTRPGSTGSTRRYPFR